MLTDSFLTSLVGALAKKDQMYFLLHIYTQTHTELLSQTDKQHFQKSSSLMETLVNKLAKKHQQTNATNKMQ